MERTDFNSLIGISLEFRKPNKEKESEYRDWMRGYVYLVRKDNRKIVAMVQEDDLFDENGNRFEF